MSRSGRFGRQIVGLDVLDVDDGTLTLAQYRRVRGLDEPAIASADADAADHDAITPPPGAFGEAFGLPANLPPQDSRKVSEVTDA